MKGIGIVLLIVGGLLMYNSYEASQSFGARFNAAIGNESANKGIALDGIVGLVLAIAGGAMAFRDSSKKE